MSNTLLRVHSDVFQTRLLPIYVYISNKFKTFGYTTTSGAKKLHFKRPNTEFYRTTFEFAAAKLYNQLPENIHSIKGRGTFHEAVSITE